MRYVVALVLGACVFLALSHLPRAAEPVPKEKPKAEAKPKVGGHWGEEAVGFRWTENDSRDGRLQDMDVGRFFSASIPTPGTATMKGIAVKLGDKADAHIIFDTELLRVSAGWTGGFLRFDPARFGLIRQPVPDGPIAFVSPGIPGWSIDGKFDDPRPDKPWGPLPRDRARYVGLHRSGERVVFEYSVGNTTVLESPWVERAGELVLFTRTLEIAPSLTELQAIVCEAGARFAVVGGPEGTKVEPRAGAAVLTVPPHAHAARVKLVIADAKTDANAFAAAAKASPPPQNLRELAKPGPRRWAPDLTTRGTVSTRTDVPYVIDTLTIPWENRFKALFFTSGHDFFANGDAAMCTAHGDVWRVSGIDAKLEKITWTRFATGLFQPLGLKVINDVVYVLGRDQITVLEDRNNDGEADFYRNFNNEAHVTPNTHEFATCLETDSAGNFYYVKGDSKSASKHDGCVLRVSKDGGKLEVFATGFRNANGMGMGPGDILTIAPQEGHWTPGSSVIEVKPGAFHGAMQSHHMPKEPTDYELPLCWIPRLADNSSGGQVWTPNDKWGLPAGRMIHLSYGQCRMMVVMRERLGDRSQGGVFDFPLDFDSGIMRGRFRPHDGQLYVTGLRGWTTRAVQDGCLQRARYTGAPVHMPESIRALSNGLAFTFTDPLDRAAAEDPDNFSVQAWNYRWSANYGSPDLKVSDPKAMGRDEWNVKSSTLSSDGKTLFLEIENFQPANQISVGFTLKGADSRAVGGTVYATIHKLSPEKVPVPAVTRPRPGDLSPEQLKVLVPGLTASFSAGGKPTDARRVRTTNLFVPRGTAASARTPAGPFVATLDGWLKVDLRGKHTLRASGSGSVTVEINGTQVLRAGGAEGAAPVDVVLRRGFNRIKIEYQSPADDDAQLRLYWASAAFASEPIPPTALFTDGSDAFLVEGTQYRRGAELISDRACLACHNAPVGIDVTKLADPIRRGPDLAGSAARLRADWIAARLLDPAGMRNHGSMPALFDPTDAGDRAAVGDITTYLKSLIGDPPAAPTSAAAQAPQGEVLFESLGCIACHRTTPVSDPDEYDRTSLHFVGSKFQAAALEVFLRQPHKHHPQSRMPDFKLSIGDAGALAAYLRSVCVGKVPAAPTGDATRGKALVESKGCLSCHNVDSRPAPAPLGMIWGGPFKAAGCLGTDKATRGKAPDFGFTPADRAALSRAQATGPAPLTRQVAVETSMRLVERLRCGACHNRDTTNAKWPPILIDQAQQGTQPETLPTLTWVGEKLRPEWLGEMFAGKVDAKMRTWIKARMPAFPAHAEALAAGLAAEHGLPPRAPHIGDIDPQLAAAGAKLTLKEGGLDCRQCHAVGPQQPTGDKSTNIAPGINFAYINHRIRPDFYRLLTLDPPRFDPGSRMPKLAADGIKTTVRNVFSGDARRQFEAIRQYLATVPEYKP